MHKIFKRLLLVSLLVGILAAVLINPAWAGETAAPQMTLAESIDMAVKNNVLVKKADKEIDRTESMRSLAYDGVTFIPVENASYDAAFEASWVGLMQADLTWRMAKKNYDSRLDGLTLDVCQKYWNVLNARGKVAAKQLALDKAQIDLNNSRIAFQLGLVAKLSQNQAFLGLEQAEGAYAKAKSDLAEAQNELSQAYLKFNQLVGLKPADRPVLIDEIAFHPLEVNDLENEVNRIVSVSPSVWLAEQGVEMQKYLHDMMWATGQYRPYEAREVEKEQAELDVINTKKVTREMIRDLYYGVKTLEEHYKSVENSIEIAREALRVRELMYAVGMATKADVINAKVSLAEAELGLKQLASQHSYAKLVFQKPWAPMYGTSSGAGK